MTIPSPGFTSADLAAEAGLTPPYSSNNAAILALLADGAIPYTSADLAGRSAPDYVPAAVNWADITWSTTAASGSGSNATQTISGINQTITLRATISTVVGGMESPTLKVYRNGSYVGERAATNGSYDFTVSNGDTVYFLSDGSTSVGSKTIAFTVTVTNLSDGGTQLDTFAVNGTVDSDNNYYDYTPSAVNWANISWSTTGASGSGTNATQTISGINYPITLRATISSYSGNIESGTLDVYRNSSYVGGRSASNGSYDFTVSVGDTVYFSNGGSTSAGIKSNSFTVSVYNMSDGGALLDTFTVSGTVDSDNNYYDYTPSSVNWGNISWSTTGASSSGNNSAQTISGINTSITLRATISSYSGNIESGYLSVYKNSGYVGERAASNGSYDFTVSNGDTVYFSNGGSTSAGTKSNSFTVSVYNLSDGGALLDTFTVSGTVDSDNNYYDYTPDAVDWPNLSASSTSQNVNAGAGYYGYFTGINNTISVRVTVSSVTGNLSSGQLDCYKRAGGDTMYGTIPLTNGSYVDTTFVNGNGLGFIAFGSTTSGIRTGGWTVTITNLTTGATIDTFTVSLTADSDNNYNVADYTPNAINWTNISATGDYGSGYAYGQTNTPTLSGTNTTINLRMSMSSPYLSGTFASGSGSGEISVTPVINGSSSSEYVLHTYSGFGNDYTADFSAPAGATIYFYANMILTDQLYEGGATNCSGGCTITITNLSDGSAVLDTFTVAVTAP